MRRLRFLAWLLAASLPLAWNARALGDQSGTEIPDCGTFALYHLLHLTGLPVDLDRVSRALGPPSPQGHSLRELRDAARKCGLVVDAVVLRKENSALNRPALLFVKAGKVGHFVVVRPIGHTGRLIQWLDGDRTPAVVDAEWVFSSTSWTGLALVPRETNKLAMVVIGCSILGLAGFAMLWRKSRGGRHDLERGHFGVLRLAPLFMRGARDQPRLSQP
jgi:hypothetical protein